MSSKSTVTTDIQHSPISLSLNVFCVLYAYLVHKYFFCVYDIFVVKWEFEIISLLLLLLLKFKITILATIQNRDPASKHNVVGFPALKSLRNFPKLFFFRIIVLQEPHEYYNSIVQWIY